MILGNQPQVFYDLFTSQAGFLSLLSLKFYTFPLFSILNFLLKPLLRLTLLPRPRQVEKEVFHLCFLSTAAHCDDKLDRWIRAKTNNASTLWRKGVNITTAQDPCPPPHPTPPPHTPIPSPPPLLPSPAHVLFGLVLLFSS